MSRREAGKIFGSGSRASVAILLLVKKPSKSLGATVYYSDIGDYLSREEKLEILEKSSLGTTDWQTIKPDAQGDWINQRSEDFPSLRPLIAEESGNTDMHAIFLSESVGLVTRRDDWVWNSSDKRLRENVGRTVDFYERKRKAFARKSSSSKQKDRIAEAKEFVGNTPRQFHWNAESCRDLANGREYKVDEGGFTVGVYRPFFKQRLYFNPLLNSRIGRFAEIYPDPSSENQGIAVTATGANVPFHALMTDSIADAHLNADTKYLSRWRYLPRSEALGSSNKLERISNVNPTAVTAYQERYGDQSITEDDLFYHVYGILHSEQYRETFAVDLGKSSVRIPMPATSDDFQAFARAGRELAGLHVGYESAELHDLDVNVVENWDLDEPGAYRVTKMAYRREGKEMDKTQIKYNAGITLTGIPEEAHEYQLGPRSALDWLVDRYEVETDSKSGITNDPNNWAIETGQPRYILDLVKRVTTVSIRTVEIVKSLPELPI